MDRLILMTLSRKRSQPVSELPEVTHERFQRRLLVAIRGMQSPSNVFLWRQRQERRSSIPVGRNDTTIKVEESRRDPKVSHGRIVARRDIQDAVERWKTKPWDRGNCMRDNT
jgi:hypothetical protein